MCMTMKTVSVTLGPLGSGFCFLWLLSSNANRTLVLVRFEEENRYVMSSVACNTHWIFLFHLLSAMFDTPSYQSKCRAKELRNILENVRLFLVPTSELCCSVGSGWR